MTHRTAAPAESNETSGKGRGLFGRAVATCGASSGFSGSGARNRGGLATLLVALALGSLCLLLTAAPASAAPPPPTIGSVSSVSYASAHITGTVDTASAPETFWNFEYSSDGGTTWTEGACPFCNFLEPSGSPVAVEADLVGLKGGTTYEVRLSAFFNDGESVKSFSAAPNLEFTTLPVNPPSVLTTNDASEVGYVAAKVSGEVERPANDDPAFDANCRFEYVTEVRFNETAFTDAATVPCNVDPVRSPGGGKPVKQPVETELTGLSVSTTYHVRLVVENAGGTDSLEAPNTFTTLFAAAPTISLESLDPGPASATITSQVNPQGHPTGAYFEYSPDGGATWGYLPHSGYLQEFCPEFPYCSHPEPVELGEGTSPESFVRTVTELEPNREYLVRLRASNLAGESVTDPPLAFRTAAVAPAVQTLSADAGTNQATLAGRINPGNSPVTYQFQWGKDGSYGNLAPATAQPLAEVNNVFSVVAAQISDLQPATEYHYRIVATNTLSNETAAGVDRTFTTPVTASPVSCPNETSRSGPSAGLPNCRAYEWVTPDSNGTSISAGLGLFNAGALADGGAIEYNTIETSGSAESNETGGNVAIASRSSAGWSSKNLNPPIRVQLSTDSTSIVGALSSDYSQSVVVASQPLAGDDSPGGGANFYLRRRDGTFVPLSKKGSGPLGSNPYGCCTASRDFSHIYFAPPVRQLESEDPVNGGNTYVWADGELKLLGILPGAGNVPAPHGAILPRGSLPSMSDDGEYALFAEGIEELGEQHLVGGPLFLRKHDQETAEVSASQLTAPDPSAPTEARSVGINADGSKVLFVSHAELTDGANTGETEGARNYRGSDLYSYDVASEKLTDLTIDDSAADAATGANVQLVLKASPDGSYVYFVATGDLAPGAISGDQNLYVWHDGAIEFIAPAGGLIREAGTVNERPAPFYVTPDGTHAAFLSKIRITGYDNQDPDTGEPQSELFEYTYKAATQCVSCRPSGVAPTSDAAISGRTLSDDGARAFFQSSDAVLPQVSGGLKRVYEYESGALQLLTPADSQEDAALIDASASGNDVFIETTEELGPESTGGVSAIYDARVNADTFKLTSQVCKGEVCRGASTTPPPIPGAASATLVAPFEVVVPDSKSVKGSKAQLRVIAPTDGEVKVSGNGLRPASNRSSKAGSVTITVALKPGANKTRLAKGVFKTKAMILFKSSSGETSGGEVSLAFRAPAKKKGGK